METNPGILKLEVTFQLTFYCAWMLFPGQSGGDSETEERDCGTEKRINRFLNVFYVCELWVQGKVLIPGEEAQSSSSVGSILPVCEWLRRWRGCGRGNGREVTTFAGEHLPKLFVTLHPPCTPLTSLSCLNPRLPA